MKEYKITVEKTDGERDDCHMCPLLEAKHTDNPECDTCGRYEIYRIKTIEVIK